MIRSMQPESGGPIETLLRSSETLIGDGHEVEVVCLDFVDDVAKRSLPFPVTALGRGIGRYGYNWRLTPWVRQNASRFDAVLLHGIWNYSSVGAWLGLRKQSIPYFILPHGMMDPWFRATYPWKHIVKQIYWWLAEGRVLRDAQCVLFTCEEERLRASNVFAGYTYSERVIRYGTADPTGDAEKEKAAFFAVLPALKDRRFMLFLGRIHPKKGCDLLIAAFAKTAARIPSDVDLVIAGPDQVGQMAGLKQLASKLGIVDRIHWCGMLHGELKWGAFRAAEAFILPSHQENFGIVVAEAMACRTPVLISDKVNIWREIESSEAGFVEPDTIEGTRNLIGRFWALSGKEHAEMANRARQGFLRYFEGESAARDLERTLGLSHGHFASDSSKKIRVLHVIRTTEPESGGPLEALLRISELLVRYGHDVEVVCLDSAEDIAQRSFSFPVAALGRGVGKYGYNPRLAPWVRRNACRFDAVILHGLWNYSSIGAWRGLRKQPTPFFIFPHGMMDPWFRNKYPLKHVFKDAYWWMAEGRVLRDAQQVLFTCEEEKMRARNVFSLYHYKERVLLFGTADPDGDVEAEKAAFLASHSALKDRRFLLFLGRIHEKKGCDLLIQAFAEGAVELPSDLDLVIAGPDQVGWVPALQELAGKLGVASRVHWPGMLRGDLKWGAIRCADALILPSHQENFGFVVAEAMACSKPVLISDKVNIWREVERSGGGIVEPDTVDGTRNLLRRYFALSKEECAQMGNGARQGFVRYFDVESTVHDLLRVIGFASNEADPSLTR